MPSRMGRNINCPSSRILVVLAVLQLAGLLVHPALAQKHFQAWFPQYRDYFSGVVRDNCSTEVALYLDGRAPASCDGRPGCLASDAVNCILTSSRQSVLANTNSAAVLLGVLPATLGFIGTSTVEIGLLWRRRPLLAALLAAGSPSVSPVRTIDYRDPRELLRHCVRARDILPGSGSAVLPLLAAVVAAQYLLALVAVANVAHVSYQLCTQTVCSFEPEVEFHPAVWAGLSLAVHAFGTWAVWLRVRVRQDERPRNGSDGNEDSVPATPAFSFSAPPPRGRLLPAREFCLCSLQSPATLSVRHDSLLLVIVSWVTATGTVMHIIYGTLVFSSIMFISARDAIVIVTRYLASIAVCRAVLMMEISGLRDVMRVEKEVDSDSDDNVRGLDEMSSQQ